MKKEISSTSTFFMKIIFPVFPFAYTLIVPLVLIFSIEGKNMLLFAITMVGFGLIFSLFIFLIFKKFKKVQVDDKFLYVSNYLKEISIPLSDIRDVTGLKSGSRQVTIHLKTPSDFGEKITFLTQIRHSTFFKPHLVVAELKELANLKE